MKAFPLFGLLGGVAFSFLGWTWPPVACHVRESRSQADAAAAVAYAALYPINSTPDPDIKPEPKDDSHPREKCPTDGWITHADGHMTHCPKCRPAYSEEEMRRDYFYENGRWWYIMKDPPADVSADVSAGVKTVPSDCADGQCEIKP